MGLHLFQEFHLLPRFLVHLGGAGDLGDPALQHLQVSKDKLQIDGLNVAERVDAAVDVDHVFILEAAHDVHDRIDLADVGQELVAQALALRRALDEAGNIHKLDHGRRDLFGVIHLPQQADPLIRNGDDAHVGVDRAEGIVGRFRARFCQRVEQCTFTYIRKSDDTQFHIWLHPFYHVEALLRCFLPVRSVSCRLRTLPDPVYLLPLSSGRKYLVQAGEAPSTKKEPDRAPYIIAHPGSFLNLFPWIQFYIFSQCWLM